MPSPSDYSWEHAARVRPVAWWKRWWVVLPLVVLLGGGLTFLVISAAVMHEFNVKAREFDLSGMDKMESASVVLDRNGAQMGQFFIQNRTPIDYQDIPRVMVEAVVAAEDNRFWTHSGVDYMGIVRAAIKNWSSGRIKQGASTVTQQLARNSFDLRERTYRRKLLEIAVANRIEEAYPKEKIMEMYLNRVYFGGGLYGVESASRGYFGVPAGDLNLGQAALLAGLLRSPNAFSPWNDPEAARAARDLVLERMYDQGFISKDEFQRVSSEPLIVRKRADPIKQSYAIDYIRQQVIEKLGWERAMNGGFRITSTLDQPMQRAAEAGLRRELDQVEARPGYSQQTYRDFVRQLEVHQQHAKAGASTGAAPLPSYLQGAVLALDNRTGAVLAMVGGRDFKHSEYNRSVQGRRPVGTAFAPIVYAAAFEKGLFPGEVVQDWPLDNRLVGLGGGEGVLGEWGVERADNSYEGEITAREAMVRGKNSAVVRLGFRTGLEAVGQTAREAGISSPLRPYANAYLGSSEATLEEMTLAYTMFPGAGERPAETYIIQRIEDARGEVVFEASPTRVRAVSDSTAFQVHSILEEALTEGTGSKAYTDYGLTLRPAAGKTGTAYNFSDVWFLGYDSGVTCGVWVGYDKPQQIYRGAFGRDLALPVWVDVMQASAADFPPQPMEMPLTVEKVTVCRATGELASDRCVVKDTDPLTGRDRTTNLAYTEYARLGKAPATRCSLHAGGLKNYVKEFAEGEWPRAAAVVDLSTVRPVNVSTPAVVGAGDPYSSVSPLAGDLFSGDVPVAQAIALNAVPKAVAADGGGTGLPAAPDRGAPAPASGGGEVRRAEPVTVDAVLIEQALPEVPNEAPPPIRF